MPSNGGGKKITKAELIKKGDAVCVKTDRMQTRELKAYSKKEPDWEKSRSGQEKAILAAGLPAIQTELEELEELGAPAGETATVEAILVALERALLVSEGDPGKLLSGKENPFTEVDRVAKNYGFKACANAL